MYKFYICQGKCWQIRTYASGAQGLTKHAYFFRRGMKNPAYTA